MVQSYHIEILTRENDTEKEDFMNIIEYENYQEQRQVRADDFPYLTYPCSIPYDFTEVPLHWHDEMEFIYIKKGSGIVSVDHRDLLAHAGDLIFICPGQLHAIRQWQQEAMEYENIIFEPRLLGSPQTDPSYELYLAPILSRQAELPLRLTPETDHYAAIAGCIDQIDEIRRTFPSGYELFIKGKLCELFFCFYQFGMISSPAAVSISDQRALEKARQILKFIEQHYSEPLSIQKMAEASGFSQSHFMKFFRQTFGTSFTGYLNAYRLTMASRLLLASEDTILTVAADTGFENLSYFNRMFKRRFGVTPSQFRRRESAVQPSGSRHAAT